MFSLFASTGTYSAKDSQRNSGWPALFSCWRKHLAMCDSRDGKEGWRGGEVFAKYATWLNTR